MAAIRVLVLRTAGINCDEEVMHCWSLVGAVPTLMHVNELAQKPTLLDDYQVLTIPGGFSYGDDIGAGVILAQRVQDSLVDSICAMVDRGGGVLGICNGFQILVKAGLLPGLAQENESITITYNESAKFEARWVRLRVDAPHCPYLTDETFLEMPIEHAEGRVVAADNSTLEHLRKNRHIAVTYTDADGQASTYPANPNGSVAGIAGLCDSTGRILGLMPHPDRNFSPTHHPLWTRRNNSYTPDGLRLFQNAFRFWQ